MFGMGSVLRAGCPVSRGPPPDSSAMHTWTCVYGHVYIHTYTHGHVYGHVCIHTYMGCWFWKFMIERFRVYVYICTYVCIHMKNIGCLTCDACMYTYENRWMLDRAMLDARRLSRV